MLFKVRDDYALFSYEELEEINPQLHAGCTRRLAEKEEVVKPDKLVCVICGIVDLPAPKESTTSTPAMARMARVMTSPGSLDASRRISITRKRELGVDFCVTNGIAQCSTPEKEHINGVYDWTLRARLLASDRRWIAAVSNEERSVHLERSILTALRMYCESAQNAAEHLCRTYWIVIDTCYRMSLKTGLRVKDIVVLDAPSG